MSVKPNRNEGRWQARQGALSIFNIRGRQNDLRLSWRL